MRFPRGVIFEQGVEDDEPFSPASGHHDFDRFAGGGESRGEGLDEGVVLTGGEGGPVADVAYAGSAAAD